MAFASRVLLLSLACALALGVSGPGAQAAAVRLPRVAGDPIDPALRAAARHGGTAARWTHCSCCVTRPT
jgi:hypothetical protein